MAITYRPKRPSVSSPVREEYKYVQPDSIDEDLYCSICHDVYDTVKRIRRCKHMFCHSCIVQALATNKKCPMCRTPCQESELQDATMTQRELDQLVVYCTFASECEWQGTREALHAHLQIGCQYVLVNCNEHEDHPECQDVMRRKDIDEHRRNCVYKMMRCPLQCPRKFYEMEEIEVHCKRDCVNREIMCSKCQEKILFYQLGEHDLKCLKKVIQCPHRNILGSFGGCKREFERKDLLEHLKTCKFEPLKEAFHGINMHMVALERKIESLQREHQEDLNKLSTLRLHASDITSTDQLRNILKYNPAVRSLHLIDFQPGTTEWQIFIGVMETNETIDSINLKGSEIEKTGAVLLGKALKSNHAVQTLVLSDNSISDQGIGFLSKALETNKTLRHLDLAGNNICDKGIEILSRALEVNFTVEHLDLSWNNIRGKGIEFLSRALEHPGCNIRTLDLSNNDIGYKGAEFLAIALEANRSLVTINLEHSKIGNQGVEAIADSLGRNNSLRRLIISENNIDDRGAESLSNGLMLNSNIHVVEMEGNLVGDVGAELVVKAMDKAAALAFAENYDFGSVVRTIYLRRNQISREGIRTATRGVKFVRVITDRGEAGI